MKMTNEELFQLRKNGHIDHAEFLRLTKQAEAKSTAKEVSIEEQILKALQTLTGVIQYIGKAQNANQEANNINLNSVLVSLQKQIEVLKPKEEIKPEPRKWEFTVKRNDRGLITGITAE